MPRNTQPTPLTPEEQLLQDKRDLMEMILRVSRKLEERRSQRSSAKGTRDSA